MSVTAAHLQLVIGGDASGAERALSNTKSRMGELLKAATGASVGFTAAVTGLVAGVGGLAVAEAAKYEQTQVAFKNMLGSTEAAQKMLKELTDFAARTPFEQAGLEQATRNLLAYGFQAKDILPMMRDIGDAVAGIGGGAPEIDRVVRAMGQMQAKGKVVTQELMQIAELGIPAFQYLADTLGVDVPTAMKMVEKGAVDAATGIAAIREGMARDFGGLMEEQSKTLMGRFSTVKDMLQLSARELGGKLIEALDIKGALEKVAGGLERLMETLKKVDLKNLDPDIIAGIAGAILGGMVPALVAAASAFAPLIPFLAVGALLGVAAGKIAQSFGGWPALFAAIKSALAPVVEMFKRTGGVLASQLGPTLARFRELWEDLKPVLGAVAAVVIPVVIGAVNGLLRAIGGIVQVLQGVIGFVVNFWKLILGLVTGNTKMVKGALDGMKNGIVNIFAGLWNAVKGFVTGFVDGVRSVIGSLPEKAKASVSNIGDKVKEALATIPARIMSWLSDKVAWVKDKFASIGSAIVNGIKDGVGKLWNSAVSKVEGLVNTVIGRSRGLLQSRSPSRVFMRLGESVVQGLALGMAGMREAATRTVDEGVGALASFGGKAKRALADVKTARDAVAEAMSGRLRADVVVSGARAGEQPVRVLEKATPASIVIHNLTVSVPDGRAGTFVRELERLAFSANGRAVLRAT